MKNRTKIVIFLIIFFIGCAFAGWGMVTPPEGVIDGSVLIFVGQVFVLAAAIYGFEVHFDIKEGKFDAGKKIEKNEENEEV